MFRSSPLLARFILLVLLPGLLLLAWGVHYCRSSIASTDGSVEVAGLSGPVSITRDSQGVAYIRGRSDRDVYFATGYAHAQDRLWQLEMHRRVAQGRLSEVFGKSMLQQDIWFRTLGLYGAAASAWPALSGDAQDSLNAYAEGINAWLASHQQLPPEFTLLGVKPAPWKPVDSLALIKIFALNLSGNMVQELERLAAAQLLDRAQMQALYPGYPADAPVTAGTRTAPGTGLAALLPLQRELESTLQIGGRFVGSNAWVVAGSLTDDGKPMLANDPHMSLQMPSLWYAVSQQGPRLRVQGMSLVGLPAVVFGANEQIAWGGTNMMADVQDIYMEQINAQDTSRYRSGNEWKPFRTETELIHVKGAFPAWLRDQPEPVKVRIRRTEHGPLISDAVAAFDQPASLRWTALDDGDTTYESIFRLSYAAGWDAFKGALALQVAPALNMLYADRAGNIGYLGAGRIPLRKRGNGELPVNGWSQEDGWRGYVPASGMPQSLNPAQGYLVSANNKVVGDDYPYFISNDWAPPARARRIEQLLAQQVAGRRPLTLQFMQTMQSDVLNLEARALLPRLLALKPQGDRQRQALEYLSAWNGEMRTDSPAAAIYAVWMPHLRRALFAPALRGHWAKVSQDNVLDSVALNAPLDAMLAALDGKGPAWCGAAGCHAVLGTSLDQALAELNKLNGGNMANWTWGSMHAIHFKHTPFSEVRLLDSLFGRKLASGGAPATINAANAAPAGSDGYVQSFGAAFRQVIAPGGAHRYVNSTGQSGHPLSRHYDDMVAPFGAGRYFSFDATAGEGTTLTLAPAAHINQEPR